MMTLEDVAGFFNESVFVDTYGTDKIYGQVLPYTDNVGSGKTARRRVLDVSANTVIPEKGTLTEEASGQVYIVSLPALDYFDSEILRKKYAMLPVENTFSIRTIGEVLAGSGGETGVYGSISYIRKLVTEDQADFFSNFDVYFPSYYIMTAGTIITDGSTYLRARTNSRIDDIGFSVTEATELYSPIATMDYQAAGTVYDPISDNMTPPAAITDIPVFVEHMTFDFVHEALGFKKIQEGDKAISFLKTDIPSPAPKDVIGDYIVQSVVDQQTYWTAHCRKQ